MVGTTVSYARSGGRPPADDERLEIAADGEWRLWRTLGGSRVGSFRGRLSADRRRRLEAALVALAAASPESAPESSARRAGPDAAHEGFRAGRRHLGVPSGGPVRGPWAPLARLLRGWNEALTADVAGAAAALELVPGRPGQLPQLARLGSDPLRVWPATLHVEAYARNADGVVVDRVSAGAGVITEGPRGDAVATGAGWSLPLPLPRTAAVPEGGTLETWAWLDVEGPDGVVRARPVAGEPG